MKTFKFNIIQNRESINICAKFDGEVIVSVFWDQQADCCCFKACGASFQTNVVTYDDYKEFVYLLDEAYDTVLASHRL